MRGNSTYCLNMDNIKGRLDHLWVLLNNQSTVHIFCNEMFLVNVRKSRNALELHTNAGSTIINEIGELPGVGTVWFHRHGIANILSFHMVQMINGYEIDYTSRPNKDGVRDRSFKIKTQENVVRRFVPDGRGLYYLDCKDYFGAGRNNTAFGNEIINTENRMITKQHNLMNDVIQTISDNESKYTARDRDSARSFRRFQRIAGHASNKTLSKAAPEYLFKTTDNDSEKISKEMQEIFHTITATVLYLSIKGRPDLQTAVAFLCTRVKSPDVHDWKKLSHLMKYIQATAFLPLILRCDGDGSVIYIDGAHAVHSDMKGHAGVYSTLGEGAIYGA